MATEYPRPWRLAFHLSWFVVDANGGIVAGPFGSNQAASEWLDGWPNPATLNVWGTPRHTINAAEFCQDCERMVPLHYDNCPHYRHDKFCRHGLSGVHDGGLC